MKKSILLSLIIIFSLNSCKKDLLNVDFNTELSQTSNEISISAAPSHQKNVSSTSFETEFILDLSNEDTEKYLSRINDIELVNSKLYFHGLSKLAGNTDTYQLQVTFDNQYSIQIDNFNYNMIAQGDPIMLNNPDVIREVAQILLNKNRVSVRISGRIPNNNPHLFKIEFASTAKITAKAL